MRFYRDEDLDKSWTHPLGDPLEFSPMEQLRLCKMFQLKHFVTDVDMWCLAQSINDVAAKYNINAIEIDHAYLDTRNYETLLFRDVIKEEDETGVLALAGDMPYEEEPIKRLVRHGLKPTMIISNSVGVEQYQY
jgi:choline kinase